ncbi:gem-associated protein 6-like [Styela clava]|uniref:gem-associated protein 6-like n=1 Tax=Styela clava TaxID=7725 RepID=UPI0019393218|nr:gem-associated protein 6-like [Styela clava]
MWNGSSITDTRKLVYQKVEVERSDGKLHVGWIYTIDPLSNNIVLYCEDSSNPQLTTVFSHCIKKVKVLAKPDKGIIDVLNNLCKQTGQIPYSEEDLLERQRRLKEWLESNRLPVTVNGAKLSIAGVLDILPPYTQQSCQSRNEIILSRVQSIIKMMPVGND